MTSTDNIKLGYPDSNGDNWQLNVRPAEALDAADIEIVSYPTERYDENVVSTSRAEADSLSTPAPAPVRWLLKRIIS